MSQKHQILRQKDSRWCQISWNRWYFEARHSYALWWFAVTPKEIKDDKSHLPPFTTSISVSHIYQLCPRWGQTNQLHASDRNPRVTARAALVWCAPAQHPTWHWRSPAGASGIHWVWLSSQAVPHIELSFGLFTRFPRIGAQQKSKTITNHGHIMGSAPWCLQIHVKDQRKNARLTLHQNLSRVKTIWSIDDPQHLHLKSTRSSR